MEFAAPRSLAAIAAVVLIACACLQGAVVAREQAAIPARFGSHQSPEAAELAERIGVTCGDGFVGCVTGRPEVGDYLNVELRPNCGPQGLYAVVVSGKSELRDRAPPLDRRTVATVGAGQAFCVKAIGRVEATPEYYYVVARPDVPSTACGTNTRCAPTLDAIAWVEPSVRDCDPTALATGQTQCAAGWIDAESVRLVGR